MMNSQFIFKGYESNLKKGEVFFQFGFNGKKSIDFIEKISFPSVNIDIPEVLLKSILDNVMLILGISYWKLYCPREIIIESNFLTKEQADFWNNVYTKGLGEFFYKNKIDFRDLVKFPYLDNVQAKTTLFPRKERTLLGFGGGKESIVAAEILKKENKEFGLLTVGTSQIQEETAAIIDKKPIIIKRELGAKLFDFNKQNGSYNGHIPISAIYAFLGLMAGIFYDYKHFVVGNEKSANYGNVEYLGEMINHQWSKSEEFEALFREYIQEFITTDILYSSPLRNMNELEVTEELVKYPEYFSVFSSCNANFKINNRVANQKWCGECPKCLFVFISLSAFLSKKEVLNIFGKNLFDNKSLLPLFEELVGVRNFKPFECVGTPEEVKEALKKILEKGEFEETFLIKHFKSL